MSQSMEEVPENLGELPRLRIKKKKTKSPAKSPKFSPEKHSPFNLDWKKREFDEWQQKHEDR